jgi:hypothetical protein
MDLNDLLQRQQVALFNAQNAPSDEVRPVHQTMADAYAARIAGSKCPTPPPPRIS